ncbi:PAS domain-containing sensor histidine kinase, partial [Staphylococcus simulans]
MKFYTRLLLTLAILIISCLVALGLLINHAIYTTISSRDAENLKHDAERINKTYKAHHEEALKEYAHLNNFTISIHSNDGGKTLFKSDKKVPANPNINVVGNPSNLLYDTHHDN